MPPGKGYSVPEYQLLKYLLSTPNERIIHYMGVLRLMTRYKPVSTISKLTEGWARVSPEDWAQRDVLFEMEAALALLIKDDVALYNKGLISAKELITKLAVFTTD